MCMGSSQQLEAFTQFVLNSHLDDELQDLDWDNFARQYNGPGQVDIYSDRLDDAYDNIVQAPNADPEDAQNEE